MGFSIGSFLGSIAGPVVGGLLGGPAGAALGTAVGAGFGGGGSFSLGPQVGPGALASSFAGGREAIRRGLLNPDAPRSQIPISLRNFMPPEINGGASQAQFRVPRVPGLGSSLLSPGVAMSAIGAILAMARQNTGGPVSSQKIRDAAKHCGLDVAASMYGLSVEQVCTVVISRRRRRRGISASALRTTRSTIRKINTMRKSLKKLGGR